MYLCSPTDTQSYVLNFHGRVTQASVKNFQIIHDNEGMKLSSPTLTTLFIYRNNRSKILLSEKLCTGATVQPDVFVFHSVYKFCECIVFIKIGGHRIILPVPQRC